MVDLDAWTEKNVGWPFMHVGTEVILGEIAGMSTDAVGGVSGIRDSWRGLGRIAARDT